MLHSLISLQSVFNYDVNNYLVVKFGLEKSSFKTENGPVFEI